MKKYKVWLEDSVEPLGGFWWYCFDTGDGYLREINYDYTNKENELDTLNQYIEWGYKIEKL
jgi:hypothetical protein